MRLTYRSVAIMSVSLLAVLTFGCGSPPPVVSVPVVTTTATTVATATAAAPADPAALFRQYVDAINRGDAAAARAFFRADATWERGGQCPPGQCTGLQRLSEEIERDIAAHHRMDILTAEVTGDTATTRLELRTDGIRAQGVERVVQLFTVRVVEGKFASLRAVNDLTDPATAAFAGPSGGRRQ